MGEALRALGNGIVCIVILFRTLLHAQMERNEIFWPKRGTCGLNPGDAGLVEGGLQRCEGCRRAQMTRWAKRGWWRGWRYGT